MRSGVGTIEIVPRKPLLLAVVDRDSAHGASPLPLRMKICWPSRLKIAPVGYQPVGMNPLTTLRAPLLTSTTATALLSALATSSVLPSGDSASELGVDVRGASGKRLIEICSMALPETVSNDQTDESPAQATNSRLPSLDSTSAFGCSSVGHSSDSVRPALE